jgi:hypothetical protein
MHTTLQQICQELDQLAATINSSIPNNEPLNVAHSNWSFPGLTRAELADAASVLASLIRERGGEELGVSELLINDYPRRLTFLRTNLVPQIWGNAALAVPNLLGTLDGLRKAVEPIFATEPDATRQLSRVTTRLRAMEARLGDIEPRSINLAQMVKRIEDAHDTADQLPADILSLHEAREKIDKLLREASRDREELNVAREKADVIGASLAGSADEAAQVIAKCDSAYSAALSQGLASAFAERSKQLDVSMWVWLVGLVIALVIGAIVGTKQLGALGELTKLPSVSQSTLILNILLSILSVGAPIWFGWLATKQIGQRFRLAEDYAFKASVSRAYEGYRKEASRIDKDLEARLLASALDRFDEQPLRLVESTSHGSPGHELVSSDEVKAALKSIPDFSRRVIDLAKSALAPSNIAKEHNQIGANILPPPKP